MKATRKTIPTLIEQREEFTNGSGTMRGIKNPPNAVIQGAIYEGQLDEDERAYLRIDAEQNGIAYVILSYNTPIAWETKNGFVYKVSQTLTQTSEQHKGLLYLFHPKG